MAKYPIYEAQGTLPGQGPNRTRHYSTDTGGALVADAMGQFAGEVFELNASIHRQQGETELAEAMADSNDAIQKMHVRFEGNTDETTYQADFDETWSEISGREIKNGWARREFALRLPQMRSNQQAIVDMAKARQVQKNWETQEAKLAAEAVTTGNVGLYGSFLGSAVQNKRITKDEFDLKMSDVRHLSQRQQLETLANNDPDAILDNYKTWDDMHKDFPDAEPAEFSYIRGLAQAQKASLERKSDELSDKLMNQLYANARTMDLDTVRAKIQQSDGLTEAQKVQAMKVVIGASQLWSKEGENPWENTQDYVSLAQTLADLDAPNGKIKSRQDISDIAFKDGKPNWSFNHWRMVVNKFDDKNKPTDEGKFSRTHPMAATYFDMLAAKFKDDMDDEGVFEDAKKAQEYTAMYGQLETAFKDPTIWRNTTKMQAAFDGIVKPVNDDKAKGWLRLLRAEARIGSMVLNPAEVTGEVVRRLFMPKDAATAKNTTPGKPGSVEEFVATVAQLKATDMAKAQAYYDMWKDQF